jgi:hypothetical protein
MNEVSVDHINLRKYREVLLIVISHVGKYREFRNHNYGSSDNVEFL